MDVSIIIVNYNTYTLTHDCIASVFKQTIDIDFEVIVSDNGSKDGSIEMIKTEFPQVILIENNENLGFGAANNRGLTIAQGKYIFYLNSDTILLNNAVKHFFDYWEMSLEKDTIGALGCVLVDKDGNAIHSGGNLPNPIHELLYFCKCIFSSKGLVIHKKHSIKIGEIGYITGADLFMLNNNNARYDENFFMYYEESDLQLNLQKKGKKRLIIDGPKIIHLEGGSEKQKSIHYDFGKKTSKYYWESCVYYLKKNLKANFTAKIILLLMKLLKMN